MNWRVLTRLVASLLALAWLAGCTKGAPEIADGGDSSTKLELFSKSKGIHLPPDMRRTLDVTTTEVATRPMARHTEARAQVYRAGTNGTQSSAIAWLDEAAGEEFRESQSVGLPAPASRGTLARLHQAAPGQPSDVEVEVVFDDASGRFPVGSSIAVTFPGATNQTALAIPESALIRGVTGTFVYVANGGNFVRTSIKTGTTTDGWIEITDGLYAGDAVAVQAAESLWLIELCAIRGGTPCCPVSRKPKKD